MYIAAAMLVGKRMQPAHFPYNLTENPQTYFARNSRFIGLNNFKFGS